MAGTPQVELTREDGEGERGKPKMKTRRYNATIAHWRRNGLESQFFLESVLEPREARSVAPAQRCGAHDIESEPWPSGQAPTAE